MENQNEILDSGDFNQDNDIDVQEIISLNKFIILSIVSFGLYEIWWMYKAWRFFQQKDKLDVMPAARAIFAIFFLTTLFNGILEFAKKKGYTENYSSVSLFIGFFIVNLMARLPEPLWLISIFSFLFFIAPYKALNFAKQNSTEFTVIEQTSFNGKQIALLVIGLLFWGLVLLGLTTT